MAEIILKPITKRGEIPPIPVSDPKPIPLSFSKKFPPRLKFKLKPLNLKTFLKSKKGKIILSVLAFLLALSLFLYLSLVKPAFSLAKKARQTKQFHQDSLKTALESKDIAKIKEELDLVKKDLDDLHSSYQSLSFWGKLPYVKNFYQDGQRLFEAGQLGLESLDIVLESVEPYQDFLGLSGGEERENSDQTTEDRINFLTESVEGLVPYLNDLESKVEKINQLVNEIDIEKYPDQVYDLPLKEYYYTTQSGLENTLTLIKDGRPLIEKTSWLLGKDEPRRYFMLLQNNAELRPTGGFWTAYGVLEVKNGKVKPLLSDDIYHLDSLFQSTIPAPRPLKEYHINVPYWNLRDMNLSPDLPTSLETFLKYYKTINKSADQYDAFIILDTQVLLNIVEVFGKIGLGGDWGELTTEPDKRCDGCPQAFYYLEYLADKPQSTQVADRKGFLGPMMQSILANVMGAPKEKIPAVAQAFLTSLKNKNLMFYFPDPGLQKSALSLNIAGAISQPEGDYLHLNDANFAGAKTNMFINQSINHQITPQADRVDHKVTITYDNPSPASNCNLEAGQLCLNAPKYRNWFRLYTPLGSTLTKMTGSEVEVEPYEELGKTVFEGFYGEKYPLYAQSKNRVTIEYSSPISPSADYVLNIQKQPGSKPIDYTITVNKQDLESFSLDSDRSVHLKL
jgi:hypothetical protein